MSLPRFERFSFEDGVLDGVEAVLESILGGTRLTFGGFWAAATLLPGGAGRSRGGKFGIWYRQVGIHDAVVHKDPPRIWRHGGARDFRRGARK